MILYVANTLSWYTEIFGFGICLSLHMNSSYVSVGETQTSLSSSSRCLVHVY
jgi:hypothetical protein